MRLKTAWQFRVRLIRLGSFNLRWQCLIAAIVGAALGAVLTTWMSDYSARRQEALRNQTQCFNVSATLMSATNLIGETTSGVADKLGRVITPSGPVTLLLLPAFDESLHEQASAIGLLDGLTRDAVLREEYFYRSLRTDLASTADVYHTGDTFGVRNNQDRQAYQGVSRSVTDAAARAYKLLEDGQHCKALASVALF